MRIWPEKRGLIARDLWPASRSRMQQGFSPRRCNREIHRAAIARRSLTPRVAGTAADPRSLSRLLLTPLLLSPSSRRSSRSPSSASDLPHQTHSRLLATGRGREEGRGGGGGGRGGGGGGGGGGEAPRPERNESLGHLAKFPRVSRPGVSSGATAQVCTREIYSREILSLSLSLSLSLADSQAKARRGASGNSSWNLTTCSRESVASPPSGSLARRSVLQNRWEGE